MPRTARKKSRTGIYHVIMRGNNRDRIFHCEQDYGAFLKRLRKYRDECGFGLYAYCLMDNHVHLLLKEEDDVYLATALRYIHRNPVKACLCNDPADFPWSSYISLCWFKTCVTDDSLR